MDAGTREDAAGGPGAPEIATKYYPKRALGVKYESGNW